MAGNMCHPHTYVSSLPGGWLGHRHGHAKSRSDYRADDSEGAARDLVVGGVHRQGGAVARVCGAGPRTATVGETWNGAAAHDRRL